MGDYLRRFWAPVARSAAVERGKDPVLVKVLGASVVLYRLDDGTLGCLDERCPHRGASLSLGFNSGRSLTCIYHGWEFGAGGGCVGVPTEPEGRRERFRRALTVNNHPTRESGGMIWVYLGAGEPPPFPDLNFMGLDEAHCKSLVGIAKCGWVQCLEGLVDTAHLGQLHKTQFPGMQQVAYEAAPSIIVRDKPYGMRVCADRPRPDGGHYYRITEFLAPFWIFVPQAKSDDRAAFGIVPIDDTHTMQWIVWYNRGEPVASEKPLGRHVTPLLDHPDDFSFRMRQNPRWGQDRDKLGRDHFSGIDNLFFEDLAVQESQGAILRREQEHLGSSDIGVVRLRKILKDAVLRTQEAGVEGRFGNVSLPGICGSAFESDSDDWDSELVGDDPELSSSPR